MARTYQQLLSEARDAQLDIFGTVSPHNTDTLPEGCQTLLLLGPHEPGFWSEFSASHEYQCHTPNPLDQWSKRVVAGLAHRWGGRSIFPSDGPPYPSFISWALASGRAWSSPVTLLVHDRAGLMVSYRGAVTLPYAVSGAPAPGTNPCLTCAAKPCQTACPVDAMRDGAYDVEACHSYLSDPSAEDCMSQGCSVRCACPASQSYGRVAEQSAFHMRAFHKG